MRHYKSKNILIGIAIILTTLLLFVIPSIGKDMVEVNFAVINKIYPCLLYTSILQKKRSLFAAGEASHTAVLRFVLHMILTISILTWVNYRYNRRTVPVTDDGVPKM